MNKIFDVLGTILLAVGLFFAFLPHASHEKTGFAAETHSTHVATGITLLLIGRGILIVNNNALKSFKNIKNN